jgi:poly(rC)-binding protein 3/4
VLIFLDHHHSLLNRSDGHPTGVQSDFHIPFKGSFQANGPFHISERRPNIVPFLMLPDAPIHGHAAVPVEHLTFRLLCSKDKVGSIIGRGGNVVNSIQNDTCCEIKVLETVLKSDDCIRMSGPAVITSIFSCQEISIVRIS